MKVYKYRDLSQTDDGTFDRLRRILQSRTLWCASPDALNDREEFRWTCDFTPSFLTVGILAQLLVAERGHPWDEAHKHASDIVNSGRLREFAQPEIDKIVRQCRKEIGLCCLGTSPNNETLWTRYAGGGAGVCIEFDIPEESVGTQWRYVDYSDVRTIHVDDLVTARVDHQSREKVYTVALLSKSRRWQSFDWEAEQEIRFVSKAQKVNMVIDGSISRVILGSALDDSAVRRVHVIAGIIPVEHSGM